MYRYDIPCINGKPMIQIPDELRKSADEIIYGSDKVTIFSKELVDAVLYYPNVKVIDLSIGEEIKSLLGEYSYPGTADVIITKDDENIYAFVPANNWKGYRIIDNGEAGTSLDNPGDDLKVTQQSLDYMFSKVKDIIFQVTGFGTSYSTPFINIQLHGKRFFFSDTLKIKYTFPYGGGAVNVPVYINGNFAEIFSNANPIIYSEPNIDGALTQNVCLEKMFIHGVKTNNGIELHRWKGFLRDVMVDTVNNGIILEMAWGKFCFLEDVGVLACPQTENDASLHIIEPKWDNTNIVTFFNCYFSTSLNWPGYCILVDDKNCHDLYFEDVNVGDWFSNGVKIPYGHHHRFINCHLGNTYIEQSSGGALFFDDCTFYDTTYIKGFSLPSPIIIQNSEFDQRGASGNVQILIAKLHNCLFMSKTIIGADTVGCTFHPDTNSSDYIVKFIGGSLHGTYIHIGDKIKSVNDRIGRNVSVQDAIQIGDSTGTWQLAQKFIDTKIECGSAKIGFHIYSGSTPIIENAYITVNAGQVYSTSDCYALYNEGVTTILKDIKAPYSNLYNLWNSIDDFIIDGQIRYGFLSGATKLARNGDVATITGDGTTTSFTVNVEHGLIIDNINKIAVEITPSQGTLEGYNFVDLDNDGFKETLQFTVSFAAAPSSGTVIPISWSAKIV